MNKLGRPPRPVAGRFSAKFIRLGPDECWEWTASKYGDTGYGQFDGRRAHRAALLFLGWFVGALSCGQVYAAEWLISPGGVSWHQDRSANYRERNPGLIIEVREGNHSILGGQFKNSFNGDSHLLVYRYRAVERAGFGLGGAAGFVDGYPAGGGDPRPVAAPVASYDHGPVSVLVLAIPPVSKEIEGWTAIAALFWRFW